MGARWPITILVLFFYTSKGNINTVNSIYSSLIVVLRCYFCILPFSLETATSWSGLIILPFRHSVAPNFYKLCLPFLAHLKITFLPFSQNTVPSHNMTIIFFICFFSNLFSWYVSCSLCMVSAVTRASQHEFMKRKFCLTNLVSLCYSLTHLMGRERLWMLSSWTSVKSSHSFALHSPGELAPYGLDGCTVCW